ncbi:delta-sarcoglycan-like isoform 2-T2 [Salvelinus alpinus]
MTQEQCTHRNNVQSSEKPHVYKVGIYGWRKRCLYFFVLLLMILILVNLALTIWIVKVMNFTIDGMGNLRITEKGLKLEGDSEFLQPLYAKEIQSRPGSPLFLQSSKNVSVNILNGKNQLVTQLIAGSSGVRAQGKMLEVKSSTGKLLFSADDQEVVVGAERLRVTGVAHLLHYPLCVYTGVLCLSVASSSCLSSQPAFLSQLLLFPSLSFLVLLVLTLACPDPEPARLTTLPAPDPEPACHPVPLPRLWITDLYLT